MRDEQAQIGPTAAANEGSSVLTAPDAPEVVPLATPDGPAPEAVARSPSPRTSRAPPTDGGSSPDAPGDRIVGRYEILARLGAGGMGVVYRAHDHALHEDVALKVLRRDLSDDPRARERFQAEVRFARRIADPGVCRVFDIGEADGQTFLTMELCRGGTLRSRIHGERSPVQDSLRWIGEIARGLAAMHREGILHRDLKPENVLFRQDGAAVVSDFGLALPADASTATASGTPVYMSPEQLRGEPLDEKSDVFALGLLAHEVLTGHRPFGEGPAAVVTSAILRGAPGPLEIPGAPAALERALSGLIGRSLSKRPADRPRAALFAEEIEALRERPLAESPRAAPRGHRVLRVAAPVVVVTLLLAITWLPRGADGPPARTEPSASAGMPVASSASGAPSSAAMATLHVPPAQNLTGDPAVDDIAAAVTDTARRALSTVPGLRLAGEPEGARLFVSSVLRVEGRLRFSGQTLAPGGHAEPEISVEAASASALLDAVRDRVIAEGRLQVTASARARRVAACTTASEPLARYERLVGPAPRSEHVAAGLPLLDLILAQDTKCAHAHVERAQLLALRAAGERDIAALDLAERALDAAEEAAPGDVAALSYRCRLAVFRPSMTPTVDDAALEAAERACKRAQEADPESAQVWKARASLFDRTCRDEEAMEALEEVARRDRGLAGDALAHLVGLALQNGRIGMADRTSLELLALQEEEARLGPAAWSRRSGLAPPEHAHFARAEVLLRLGRDAEAVDLFRQELARAGAGSQDLLAELASLRAVARLGARVHKPISHDEAGRLRALEAEISTLASRDPSVAATVAGALLWKDTDAAIRWIERAPAPESCTAAVQRALIYKAGERIEPARRALAGCEPRAEWERRCLAWARERVGQGGPRP